MTRLDAIRKRLEAATPERIRLANSSYMDDVPNAVFVRNAPQDLRDLLTLAEAVKAIDWNYVHKMVWTPPSMGQIGVAKKEHHRIETLRAILFRLDAEVEE